MNFKKVVALSICAAMVAGMSASTVMAADLPDQFKDLKANKLFINLLKMDMMLYLHIIKVKKCQKQ